MPATTATRLKLAVRGAVQGVGFRPFVYRLANDLGLKGWINNSSQGVLLEVEGPRAGLEKFLARFESEKPPRSFFQSIEATWLDPVGHSAFEIRDSDTDGEKGALVLPDITICPECVREIFDSANRRYRYPFTNCTNCGPRFTIIEKLPYDRANTAMKAFTMCAACQAEYEDPRNRRFHAQPNACPQCGPRLELWDPAGTTMVADFDAFIAAADAIRAGRIVALKGLGGFQLLVAAHNEKAVAQLRYRKRREEKPLAVLFPNFESVKAVCKVSRVEKRALLSPEAPIVLLRRISTAGGGSAIVDSIAPKNPYLGAMLPYTPLHHLLVKQLGFPVVATSGNLSDEPICIDEREALRRLAGIADLFLVHNRPIVRHVDDSVVRVIMDRELVLRRARGYAPLPITLKPELSARDATSVLAVGAHLKNTVALSAGSQVFLSQHIGDLETEEAYGAFRRVVSDFETLYETKAGIIAADLHPDYLSTKFAAGLAEIEAKKRSETPRPPSFRSYGEASVVSCNKRLVGVQHHVAHVLSCMAENEISPPVLGVAWDGTGFGLDGMIWGGEFFLVAEGMLERIGNFRPFRLPGGDKAIREPRRSALGLLYELHGEAAFQMKDLAAVASFSDAELAMLRTMLERRLNSPQTTSIGRLFDAVASLVGLRQKVAFEGQAAMELEFALDGVQTAEGYPFRISTEGEVGTREQKVGVANEGPAFAQKLRHGERGRLFLDWAPVLEGLISDVKLGTGAGLISARLHNGLTETIVTVAKKVGQERVVLSGGCFQNRYLTECAVRRLEAAGFRPYWHQRVPPNDGGIALGQVVAAWRQSCFS